jgi:hypothetical protein
MALVQQGKSKKKEELYTKLSLLFIMVDLFPPNCTSAIFYAVILTLVNTEANLARFEEILALPGGSNHK